MLQTMEVFIVLCPSSLAHWLVGFWSGDFHCFCLLITMFFGFWFLGLLVFDYFFFFVSGLWPFYFLWCFNLFGDFQSLLASACQKFIVEEKIRCDIGVKTDRWDFISPVRSKHCNDQWSW